MTKYIIYLSGRRRVAPFSMNQFVYKESTESEEQQDAQTRSSRYHHHPRTDNNVCVFLLQSLDALQHSTV